MEEVVKTLMRADAAEIMPDARGLRKQTAIGFVEEYHRYPARDGIEYGRIHSAFAAVDT